MTAQVPVSDDLLLTAGDPLEAVREHIMSSALRPSPGGRVGLELEFHLVDLRRPSRRPTWAEVQALLPQLPAMPGGSTITLEPGGQLELSTPPRDDVVAAVAALRADRAVLHAALARAGYGSAPLGADPARPVERINPAGRYAAMEEHFTALGCAEPGKAMIRPRAGRSDSS
jgi:glutamate--cysteine ligase